MPSHETCVEGEELFSSVGGRRIPTRIVHRRKTDNRTKSGVLGIRQLEKGGQHETFPPERTLKAAISLIHNFACIYSRGKD